MVTAEQAKTESADKNCLSGQHDAYDGVIVDVTQENPDVSSFVERLQRSLEHWRDTKRRGIWLKVPLERAAFVGPAVQAGFVFHHAEPDYVMLTQWLPETENKLPHNASHQVGIGAFVINENDEVLVVQEGAGPLKGKGVWKMPTGIVMAGEDIVEAAEREVLEETGIKAECQCLLAVRQAHGVAFDKSDIFAAIAMRASPGQRDIKIQEDELEAATWMPLQEFADNSFMRSRPLWNRVLSLCVAWAEGRYPGMQAHKIDNGFNGREDLLIYGDCREPSSL
eukprot:jgi/Botrbrau1/18771/Bobra.0386s0089.2